MKYLEAYGFQLNLYYPRVAKNSINGKQTTVVWHVDNLKLSHVEIFDTTNLSGYLSTVYGGLTVHRGKVHAYLGMDLNYSKKGVVK